MKDIQHQQVNEESIPRKLKVEISRDNLVDKASFEYSLINSAGETLKSDVIHCEGQDYINWSADNENINDYPYTFVASTLGLTIQ